MRRTTLAALAALALIAAAAACSGSITDAKRAPLPTAPALDGGVPCDSAKSGPILGGGSRC